MTTKLYAAATYTPNYKTPGMANLAAMSFFADSKEEAIGKAYAATKEQCPSSAGWGEPNVTVIDVSTDQIKVAAMDLEELD